MEEQHNETDNQVVTPSSKNASKFESTIALSMIGLGVILYFIGLKTILTLIVWAVLIAAVIIAVVCITIVSQSKNDEDKVKAGVGAGVCIAIAFGSWYFYLGASSKGPIANQTMLGIVKDDPGGNGGVKGLEKSQLNLASITIFGSWVETDLLGNQTNQWSGSAGAIKSESGKLVLVSNSHCLGLAELAQADSLSDGLPDIQDYKLEVIFASGKRRPVLRFGDQEGSLDLAMLEVDATNLSEGQDYVLLPFSDSLIYEQGAEVVAVGSPKGLSGTQTFGRISAIREVTTPEPQRFIQTDAAINPGNSGGPLFVKCNDDCYAWIGINTWKIIDADNLGFAIDSRNALESKYLWYSADAKGAALAIANYQK
jgi:S1-C subfamily serine protease